MRVLWGLPREYVSAFKVFLRDYPGNALLVTETCQISFDLLHRIWREQIADDKAERFT